MKTIAAILLVSVGLSGRLVAQDLAGKTETGAYLIPFNTDGPDPRSVGFTEAKRVNRIELAVANGTGEPYEDVGVRAVNTPAWIDLQAESDEIGGVLSHDLVPKDEATYVFTFSVDDSAPTEETETLTFEVYSGDELVATKEIDIAVELPKELVLRGNYPNPFNPSTTIGFVLPEDGDVTLEVFDAAGRRVDRLAKYDAKRGQQTLRWNASSRASGVYFYRLQLQSGERLTETRLGKMVFIK